MTRIIIETNEGPPEALAAFLTRALVAHYGGTAFVRDSDKSYTERCSYPYTGYNSTSRFTLTVERDSAHEQASPERQRAYNHIPRLGADVIWHDKTLMRTARIVEVYDDRTVTLYLFPTMNYDARKVDRAGYDPDGKHGTWNYG